MSGGIAAGRDGSPAGYRDRERVSRPSWAGISHELRKGTVTQRLRNSPANCRSSRKQSERFKEATDWIEALRRHWRLSVSACRIAARGKSRHGIRPSLHPGGLRCDSVTYSRYAPSSRLVRRAQERSRCSRDFHHGLIVSWINLDGEVASRSLRGRNDRSEKVGNRGRIFSIWRCIVVLFAEKSGKYGPILPLSQ